MGYTWVYCVFVEGFVFGSFDRLTCFRLGLRFVGCLDLLRVDCSFFVVCLRVGLGLLFYDLFD